ncbi:TetR/AcrR family transcriptional regulator [Actinomycetospora straminea]|uniref:TetR/AcrR family transcriptional regulator n=1 Tax=Actinomycetospora straminea TaxID=663607 RepID=A0ABP9E1S7_9PSEU|nr:TetR/AcrR family transcriptional regulator [Actinomycetospora straminea]MDD7931217.1 TetR/AcrR family transcriptional regulator [Actinomycetospora straminea]
MPKQVDHHERRTLLADALLRVAAERGLMDVSLRHVAAEAGVTAGMVQHYFRTKDEMMIFALDVVAARVQARLADDPDVQGDPRRLVRALLVQLLPLDADRELEGRVAVAFHAYAASRPDVAARLREDTRGMRAAVAAQVRSAPGALDPEIAATGLLSLVEGLAVHVLGGHLDPADALATLDAHLALAFTPAGTPPRAAR